MSFDVLFLLIRLLRGHIVVPCNAAYADNAISERSRLLKMVDAKSIAELVENGGTLSPRPSRRPTKKSGLQVVDLFEYVVALFVFSSVKLSPELCAQLFSSSPNAFV